MIVLGWGFLFSSRLVDFLFWPFFLCRDVEERLGFSPWTWWCASGGSVPWGTFHGGFLDGLGLRGAKAHFLSYFAPFRHLLVRFSSKFFRYCSRSFPFMLCVKWVYSLLPIPGVHILPFLVQYAWFIPSDCVAKFRYSSGQRGINVC